MDGPILMMYPLVVIDTHNVVTVFEGEVAVTRQLEGPDVVDKEFRLFDMTGTEYRLIADTDASPVVIGSPVGEPDFDFILDIALRYLAALPEAARKRSPVKSPRDPRDLSRALRPFAI